MDYWWTKFRDRVKQTAIPFQHQPDGPRIGLALSGGGERGVAHIGVVAVLEEAGLQPHLIAGTSAGSMVGGLLAAGWDSQRILEAVRRIQWSQIRRFSWSDSRGILRSEAIAEWYVNELGGDLTFDELELPLTIVAAELMTGSEVLIHTGSVAQAVRASSCVPGMFTPCEESGGRMLVDGGVVNNLPVDVVRDMGADYVIGVDVSHHNTGNWPDEQPKNVIDVMNMVYYILRRNTDQLHEPPDCLVTPVLPVLRLSQVAQHADELYEAGRRAMLEKLPQVLADLKLDVTPPLSGGGDG